MDGEEEEGVCVRVVLNVLICLKINFSFFPRKRNEKTINKNNILNQLSGGACVFFFVLFQGRFLSLFFFFPSMGNCSSRALLRSCSEGMARREEKLFAFFFVVVCFFPALSIFSRRT